MLHFRWLDTRSIYWLALLAAVLIKINWYLQHINNRADAIGTSAINKTAASVSRRKQNWHSKVRATESFDSGMTHYRSRGISKKSHSLRPKVFWIIQHQFVYLKWKSWLPKSLKYSLSLIFPIFNFWQMGCVYGWKVNVPKRTSPYHQLIIKNPCAQLNDTQTTISLHLIIVTRRTR